MCFCISETFPFIKRSKSSINVLGTFQKFKKIETHFKKKCVSFPYFYNSLKSDFMFHSFSQYWTLTLKSSSFLSKTSFFFDVLKLIFGFSNYWQMLKKSALSNQLPVNSRQIFFIIDSVSTMENHLLSNVSNSQWPCYLILFSPSIIRNL